MKNPLQLLPVLLLSLTAVFGAPVVARASDTGVPSDGTTVVRYATVASAGVDLFYREAGDPARPTIVLLHGFPSSSHMFRNLIPALATRYHVLAPDLPGFGQSAMPEREKFAYTFDHFAGVIEAFLAAKNVGSYSLYVMDYGAPVGFRIAAAAPGKVRGLIIQNGNAYDEGLSPAWAPIRAFWQEQSPANTQALRQFLTAGVTRWQYTQGVRDATLISPDAWTVDQAGLDRPGNDLIQLDLFLDYRNNPKLYPVWQAYFREHQPPTLIVWGKNDPFFTDAGARAYLRDLPKAELHFFDTGHFALEEEGAAIAARILDFLQRQP